PRRPRDRRRPRCPGARLDLRCEPHAHRPVRRPTRSIAPMATPTQLRSYGRIGLLATTFVLAAALVVGAWLNYRSSQDAVSTLYRGQAEVVEAALRSHFPPWAA